jgi:ribosomal protein L7Ae-like RNA K-turn-binding protein
MKDKILSLLGLATRARRIVLGEEFVLKQMSKGNKVVFLANDAGANITKKVLDKASSFNCIVFHDFTTDEISKAMGKTNRKVVLIEDQGFSKKFKEYKNS